MKSLFTHRMTTELILLNTIVFKRKQKKQKKNKRKIEYFSLNY